MRKSDQNFCPILLFQVWLVNNAELKVLIVISLWSGGNTKFPGFEKRLYQELSELFDEKTTIKVKSLPNRELLGWIGGARYVFKLIMSSYFISIFFFRLSNLSSFQRFWLTKADYQENGPVVVHDNSKIFEDIKNSNNTEQKVTAWWSQCHQTPNMIKY